MPSGPFPTLCPECGTPARALPLRKPRHLRLAQFLPLAALFLALAFIIYKNYESWSPIPAGTTFPRKTADFPEFITHRFTQSDLSLIARGRWQGPSLTASINHLDWHVPEGEISACFLPPAGGRQHSSRYGWPSIWLAFRVDATYDDVYDDATVTSAPELKYQGWITRTHYAQQHINHLGQRASRSILVEGFAGLAILLIASIWLGIQLSRRIAKRYIRRCSRLLPRRARIAIGLIPLVLAVALATLLSLQPRSTDWFAHPRLTTPPPQTPTGITVGELTSLINAGNAAAADALLANAILDRVPRPDPRHVLAISIIRPGSITQSHVSRGWPRGSGAFHVYWEDASRPVRDRWFRLLRIQDTLFIHRWQRNPSGGLIQHTHTIPIDGAAMLLLMLAFGFALGVILRRTIHSIHRRRQRRRLNNTLCLHCAYDLTSLARSSPTSQNAS